MEGIQRFPAIASRSAVKMLMPRSAAVKM